MQVGMAAAAAHHFLAKEDGTKGGRKVHFWAGKKEREEISIVCCPSFEDRTAVVAFSLPAAKSDKDVVVVVA